MKHFLLTAVIAVVLFSACNQSGSTSHENHPETAKTNEHTSASEKQDVKEVKAVFTDVDPKISADISRIVDQYLAVKNALASDNAADAAKAAGEMSAVFGKMDKSLFKVNQKSAFDPVETKLKESAAQIAGKTDIGEQRNQFVVLSEAVYELVKNFGGGRTLYHDYCPMAKNDEGALWISEVKEIKNPYFGSGMLTCGTVEEVIQ